MKYVGATRRTFAVLLVVVMLVVTLGSGTAAAASTNAAPGGTASLMGGGHCTYVVRPGDTLGGIAVRYHTSVAYLASINGIPNPALIRSGRVLVVPCGGGGGYYPPHPPAPPGPPPGPGGCGCVYRVRAGDTLGGIAVRYHTSVGWLASVNHLCNPNKIYAGTWLRVPCCDP
jgi:nucleoid-associated protein YgaU